MKMSPRESVLALVTLAAVVFGVSAVLVKPQVEKWKQLRSERQMIEDDIQLKRTLVANRAKWEQRYNELSQVIPQYPADKNMGAECVGIMNSIGDKNGVKLFKKNPMPEVRIGTLYEMPIKVAEWEGSLEGFVRFLYDLQYAGTMIDVRQLHVKPKGDGNLKGEFTLYCAYTRARGADADNSDTKAKQPKTGGK